MYEVQGSYLMYLQRPKEAITSFTKALEIHSSGYAIYYNRAVAYRQLSMPTESLADYDKYLKFIDPGRFKFTLYITHTLLQMTEKSPMLTLEKLKFFCN